MIKAIAFDAYGTVFDVHSTSVLADGFWPGRGIALAALWRTKQIDYTRLRTMSGRYVPFSQVTRDALVFSVRSLALTASAGQLDALMGRYDALDVFADAAVALRDLKAQGLPLAILSNGDPTMLENVVGHGGLADTFDHLLSVDTVRRFKTAPEAYALGPEAFGCEVNEILFVSSNCWDACGASWYGYTTFWINRAGLPLEELHVEPSATGRSMEEVLAFLKSCNQSMEPA